MPRAPRCCAPFFWGCMTNMVPSVQSGYSSMRRCGHTGMGEMFEWMSSEEGRGLGRSWGRHGLYLFPPAWLPKTSLQFTQDFVRMDGVMAQQDQRVEPQVCHLIDDFGSRAVLGG